jgi:hypothetical protein
LSDIYPFKDLVSDKNNVYFDPFKPIMKRCIFLYLIICFINIIVPKNTLAQVTIVDSASNQKAFNGALNVFNAGIGEQLPIYNGIEYNFYPPIYKGNAYYMDVNAFTTGAVYYDGLYFRNVPMLYDIYVDKIAVLAYNHFSKFSLLNERVKSFDFLGHHFVNILPDTSENNSTIKAGFYDEIYSGKLEVLVKTVKNIQNRPGSTEYESYFSTVMDFFLKKNNVYYKVGSEGAFLSVLKDKKSELEQYIKSNNIKFRKNPEEAMVKIASYYDHLTN